MLEEIQELALRKNINLLINIEQGLAIYGNQSMLTQLLINLLDNAVKYTPGGEKIYSSAKAQNNHIEIQIKDTGIGISIYKMIYYE